MSLTLALFPPPEPGHCPHQSQLQQEVHAGAEIAIPSQEVGGKNERPANPDRAKAR
jgi:hypothetical protein